jgi:hypothetical protein
VTSGKSQYQLGDAVPFAVHRGKACLDPKAFALVSFGHKVNAGPFLTDTNGSFSPDAIGQWNGSIYRETVEYGPISFVVVKDAPKPAAPPPAQPPACPNHDGEAGAVERKACEIQGGR